MPLLSPSSFIQVYDWHNATLHGYAMCSSAVGLPPSGGVLDVIRKWGTFI